MNTDFSTTSEALVSSINSLSNALNNHQFWDTQWFAALIGALGAIAATTVKDYITTRRANLEKTADWIMEQAVFFSPDSLAQQADTTGYGHTRAENGITTVIPEKTTSEKAVIELRKHTRYWRVTPRFSRLRFLFWMYERSIQNWPSERRNALAKNVDFTKSELWFSRLQKEAERITGDNEWTA